MAGKMHWKDKAAKSAFMMVAAILISAFMFPLIGGAESARAACTGSTNIVVDGGFEDEASHFTAPCPCYLVSPWVMDQSGKGGSTAQRGYGTEGLYGAVVSLDDSPAGDWISISQEVTGGQYCTLSFTYSTWMSLGRASDLHVYLGGQEIWHAYDTGSGTRTVSIDVSSFSGTNELKFYQKAVIGGIAHSDWFIDDVKLMAGESTPPSSASTDVSFKMKVNSFAPNYASHPVSMGDASDGSQWVWIFYLFGASGDGRNGKLQVYGTSDPSTGHQILSDISEVLDTGKEYQVRWTYSEGAGGKLYLDEELIGNAVSGGALNSELSNAVHLKENIYTGGGRPHSVFDGYVWDVMVDGVSYGGIPPPTPVETYVITPIAGPGGSISPSTPQTVPGGSTPEFTLIPDPLYTVDQIIVDGIPVLIPPLITPEKYTFNPVRAPHTLHVTFRQNKFVITPGAGPGGTISPSVPQTVQEGSSPDFVFLPAPSYAIDQVLVDGSAVDWKDPWYTFPPVYASHTLHVTFNQKVPDLQSTWIGSYWEGQFRDNPPTLRYLLLLYHEIMSRGAPGNYVRVQLKGLIGNDEHVNSAPLSVIQTGEVFPPYEQEEMRKNSSGWYVTSYNSGEPPELVLNLILDIIFEYLDVNFVPTEVISLPVEATWQSIIVTDSTNPSLGNHQTLPVNQKLPDFGDAIWHWRVVPLPDEFYDPPVFDAVVWIAPRGSERIDVLVTDPRGRRVGTVVTGDTKERINEIPDALFPETMIYNDKYTVGMAIIPNPVEGVYQCKVNGNEPAEFSLHFVQMNKGELIGKSVIRDSIGQGEVKAYSTDFARVKVLPRTLNLASKGAFVAFVRLPDGYETSGVLKDSITCGGAPAEKLIRSNKFPRVFGAVFRRDKLQNVQVGDKVTLTLDGKLSQGGKTYEFTGTDTIRVINRQTRIPDGFEDASKLVDDKLFEMYSKENP